MIECICVGQVASNPHCTMHGNSPDAIRRRRWAQEDASRLRDKLENPAFVIRADGTLETGNLVAGMLSAAHIAAHSTVSLTVPLATHWLIISPGIRWAQTKIPNRFHRLMMRLAFGWRWEKMP